MTCIVRKRRQSNIEEKTNHEKLCIVKGPLFFLYTRGFPGVPGGKGGLFKDLKCFVMSGRRTLVLGRLRLSILVVCSTMRLSSGLRFPSPGLYFLIVTV
ncbi:hypothetical protein RIR_jg38407.t1 [Rhizophagus irregularis DAOM 181602=DAOM 197198]|nr:hypothetical protein RIR_jg38407.t1 [Rhizophagus irregularis DAOM 181602=DAOM 197198]